MVDPREHDGKSFINEHLKSVAFEIIFPANVRIIKEFYKFQELINEQYPEYGEDLLIAGLPENLQPPETLRTVSFIGKNSKDKVKISVNKFIFVSTDYSNYETFKSEIIHLLDIFKDIFKIKSCQRIGLRYVNVYNLEEELDDSIQLVSELFCPLYNTTKFVKDKLFAYNINVRKRIEDNIFLTYRSQFQFNKNIKKYYHVLDFDTFIPEIFDIKNCEGNLNKLHKIERDEFLLCVTEKFMGEMKFHD